MSKTIKECHCQKCGKDWWPAKPGRPAACPRCNNQQWDVSGKRPGGRGRTKAMSDEEEKAKQLEKD